MPLFGSSSPFDQDVEKITNEANTSEDWGRIMDICDKINATPNSAKDALKSIMKRLKSPVPHVAIQTITLLNACVSNCGKSFQLEVSSSEFCTEARNIISKGHPKVAEKLKQHLQEWAEEYKNEPALSLLVQLYNSLKSEGQTFPAGDSKSKSSTSSSSSSSSSAKNDPVASMDQESQDIAKAIELSLQEEKSKSSSLYPSVDTAQYATVTSSTAKKEPRKVKALYDFEAVEDNELTFKAGEIISVLDDSDINWWKGENFRGIGLFPSNFVTADLTAETEPEMKAREKKVTFDEEVEVKTIEAPEVVEINGDLMDQCLTGLQNADPTEERPDPQELLVLEESCNRMAPLIDQELEGIDRDVADYSALNHKLLDAFSMYHELMKEAPVYGYSLQTNPMQSMFPNQGMAASGPPMGQYPGPQQLPQQYLPQGAQLGQLPGGVQGGVPVGQYASGGAMPGMNQVPPPQGPGSMDPAAMYSSSTVGTYSMPPGASGPQSAPGGMINTQTPVQYHSTFSDQQAPIPSTTMSSNQQYPAPNQGSPVHPNMYQAGGQPPPMMSSQPPQQQLMM